MPELIEVELYRRALDPLIGARVRSVSVAHPDFVRPHPTPASIFDQVLDARLDATRRVGKLLLLDLAPAVRSSEGPTMTVGLRFGMTGMLMIDGVGPIDKLEYASHRNDPSWDRFTIVLGGSSVTIRDQRRLGSVEFEPDETRLGPDATTLADVELAAIARGRKRSLKSLLLDQELLAGIGNLLADEALWRAGLGPDRLAGDLDDGEVARLAASIRETIADLTARGGSHTGDSFALRAEGTICTMCGGPMARSTVGGRTSWWCSEHQRQR